MRGPLPGGQQTVYRAELYAVHRAMEESEEDLEIVSDCQGVVDRTTAVLAGADMGPRVPHADLWRRWRSQVVEGRDVVVSRLTCPK